jgi:hypothetical protein
VNRFRDYCQQDEPQLGRFKTKGFDKSVRVSLQVVVLVVSLLEQIVTGTTKLDRKALSIY